MRGAKSTDLRRTCLSSLNGHNQSGGHKRQLHNDEETQKIQYSEARTYGSGAVTPLIGRSSGVARGGPVSLDPTNVTNVRPSGGRVSGASRTVWRENPRSRSPRSGVDILCIKFDDTLSIFTASEQKVEQNANSRATLLSTEGLREFPTSPNQVRTRTITPTNNTKPTCKRTSFVGRARVCGEGLPRPRMSSAINTTILHSIMK